VYTVASTEDGQITDLLMRGMSEFGAFSRLASEPEVTPEERMAAAKKVCKEFVGLERAPDAYVIIDTHKADNMGVKLDMVQSADREEVVLLQGPVPSEIFARIEANEPVDLPESLRAKIVDPRSFNDIPILNLDQDEDGLLKQMRYACEVVGFMQVVGHGVSQELQDRHMEMQRRFFQLPDDVKARLMLNDDCPVRGYFGRGGEDLDQLVEEKVDSAGKTKIKPSRVDNKEALDMNGAPWSKPRGGDVARFFGMASRFPEVEELPGFKETMEEYSAEMFRLARRLLSVMAMVLGKPADYFEQFLTAPVATLRLLHYWPIENFNTQIGVGEHTDYGLLTLLRQDSVGGLQVLNAKDSEWVHCCPLDGAFVVNIGDMLGRWTAHRFKSTVHRVVNTSDCERFSTPFFLEPNMDTIIRYGELCDGALGKGENISEHTRRCRLRKVWAESRKHFGNSATAEEILERFYRASGQLKVQVRSFKTGS